MFILLPPSETKAPGGACAPLDLNTLSYASELSDARMAVLTALEELSQDRETALAALKLGAKSASELEHNLVLTTSATMPAIERYTGVLYDALGYSNLPAKAKEWVNQHVFVQSALFGLVGAGDMIPAYRLSCGTRLAIGGKTLKNTWLAAHQGVELDGFVLDARSGGYAAMAKFPGAYQLLVYTRAENGELKALNHFNKAGKGDLLAKLATSDAEIASIANLISWAGENNLEITADENKRTVTLITQVGAH